MLSGLIERVTGFSSHDPGVMEKSGEFSQVRVQLSKLTFSGPGKEGSDAYRKKVAALHAQKERLEAQLSRRRGQYYAYVQDEQSCIYHFLFGLLLDCIARKYHRRISDVTE